MAFWAVLRLVGQFFPSGGVLGKPMVWRWYLEVTWKLRVVSELPLLSGLIHPGYDHFRKVKWEISTLGRILGWIICQ